MKRYAATQVEYATWSSLQQNDRFILVVYIYLITILDLKTAPESLILLHCASVTPGFKDKTECIAICMPGSSFIYIETS